jgi:hypothetical protein
MKRINFVLIIVSLLFLTCKKENTNVTGSMSASINGSNNESFTGSVVSGNGSITYQGAGTSYTIQLVLGTSAVGNYTLADPSSGYYAIIYDAFGTKYSTNAYNNTGTVSVTAGSSSALVNGTFSFSAVETSPTPNGLVVNVTNGTFSNL